MQTNNPISNFLNFLEAYRGGIFVLLWVLVVVVLLLQWLAWIFARGRFKHSKEMVYGGTAKARPLTYIFSEAIIHMINDFRHVIAVIILSIFGFALIFALFKTSPNIANMKDALTGVVASLGGLVGSIIGYYFGEYTALKSQTGTRPDGVEGGGSAQINAVQSMPESEPVNVFTRAPAPPSSPSAGTGVIDADAGETST